ncbi:MAG TPA: glycosyltransferase family 39 protein [Acidimicrobiales bacterium]|nr:glycosyltransferase family 39 protein [Acidimicrobiales bacterium]
MTTTLGPAVGTPSATRGGGRYWGWAAAATMALGAATSVAFLGRGSLYLDETVSTTIAKAPWHRFTQSVLHRESNMALYYLVLRVWSNVGHSEVAVRSLSVVASLGALAVLVFLTRELFGPRAALIGGVLLAVNPLIVELAQDTRGYALSLLLVSASSALFVRGLRRSSGWPMWAAYVVVSALAAYTNFWAALVPLSHACSLAFTPPGRVAWRRLVASAVGLAVLLVPLGLLIRSNDSSGVNWASGTSAGHIFSKVRDKVPHSLIDVGILVVVVAVVGMVVVLKRRPRTAAWMANWPVMFTLCWLVVPVAAVVFLSFAYKPLLVVRYLIVFLPPAVMLVGAGLARLSRRAMAVGLTLLVAASGAGLWHWYAHGPSEDWRAALTTIADRSQPGDGVVVFPAYMRIPFEWYLQGHPAAQRRLEPVFPSLGWQKDPLLYDSDVPVQASTVSAAAQGHARVWLVLSQADLYAGRKHSVLTGLAAAGLHPVHTFGFTGISVVEYATSRPTTE